jgi:hypothetical protein
MTAKEQAILDIKEELKEQHKSFLAFHKNLNSIMDKLVENQLKLQASIRSITND